MQRSTLIKVIVAIVIVAGVLIWFAQNGLRRHAEELARCNDEATSAVESSNDRVASLLLTMDAFLKGRKSIEPTLQELEELRSSNEAIRGVIKTGIKNGHCRIEHKPVIALLELEDTARGHGLEYVTHLIRASQQSRLAEQYKAEKKDYASRYARLRQPHLKRQAEKFADMAGKAQAESDKLSKSAEKFRTLFNKELENHRNAVKAIG